MTTTLRPEGPLQETPDGVRSRTYRVCVNSRPVGTVALGTDPAFGPTAGVLRSLEIDGPDRRRGRGTVAALAAEEILRDWGCRQVLASVPAGAEAAVRMFGSLLYEERSWSMVKELPAGEPPALPAGTAWRPMGSAEYEDWLAAMLDGFAANWTARGMSPAQARAKAESSRRQSLPEGLATPGTSLGVLVADGAPVGHLWVARQESAPGTPGAYVYDVGVREDRRGEGFGRALMVAAEQVAAAWGASGLGLHVFRDNTPAVRLYVSLGHQITTRHFAKPLF